MTTKPTPPTRAAFSTPVIKGCDVYHGDEIESFHALAAAGMQFVFCKASQGATGNDPAFASYWPRAKAAGLIRGAYHFFTPDADPIVQAKHFVNLVQLAPGDLPLCLDVETEGADIGKKAYAAAAQIKAMTGYWPIIYSGNAFYADHLATYFPPTRHTLWIARYGNKPSVPCAFWQNSETGHVTGINHAIDTNLFNGTIDDLKAICIK